MRAVYLKDLDLSNTAEGDTVSIIGERARHLIKVVRIRVGEKALILNGRGIKIKGEIRAVLKRTVELIVESREECIRNFKWDLLLGITKKEAFEDTIRFATEIGFTEIKPVRTEYSLQDLGDKLARFDRVMESALIQSNNPFHPRIGDISDFAKIEDVISDYDHVFYFSSRVIKPKKQPDFQTCSKENKVLIIIGPEGGLSVEEEDLLMSDDKVCSKYLPTNILRTPTAVCVASGFIMGLCEKE